MARILKKNESPRQSGSDQKIHAEREKLDSLAGESGGIVHKKVLDSREKAEEILNEAEKEADRLLLKAKKVLSDAQVSAEEAIKKGFKDGEAKGLKQVTEKLVAFEKIKEIFYETAEPEIIKLSMSIAEKVIGKLATENKELIKTVVRQALERTLGDRIVVRLNPEDYESIMEGEHEFKEVLDRTKRLLFKEDESITRGGCVVESEVGTIDAQLELQLEAIKKALEI